MWTGGLPYLSGLPRSPPSCKQALSHTKRHCSLRYKTTAKKGLKGCFTCKFVFVFFLLITSIDLDAIFSAVPV